MSNEVLTTIGPAAAAAVVAAGAIVAVFLKYGRRKNGNDPPSPQCPLPEHVAMLAAHQEAIETLKEGQTTIFKKLDDLPQKVADAVRAKR